MWLLGVIATEKVLPTLAIEVGASGPCVRFVPAIAKRRDAARYVNSFDGGRALSELAPTAIPEPCQLDRGSRGISANRDSATALVGVTNCNESLGKEGLS